MTPSASFLNNANSIFRAPSTSYEGPFLPKASSSSSSSYNNNEDFRRHLRTHSKDSSVASYLPPMNDEENDDIILEQSPVTRIMPADNQLLSAWSFFASRFTSKSEFQDY